MLSYQILFLFFKIRIIFTFFTCIKVVLICVLVYLEDIHPVCIPVIRELFIIINKFHVGLSNTYSGEPLSLWTYRCMVVHCMTEGCVFENTSRDCFDIHNN